MSKRAAVFASGSEEMDVEARLATPGRLRAAFLVGGLTIALLVLVLLGPAPAHATPPTITCPADVTGVEATGPDGASVDPGAATASDPDGGSVTVTRSPSGNTFALGTTTVTHTATDTSGETASCTNTVTVVDTTAPSITCPANITAEATGNRAATVDVPAATATDLAGGVSVSDPAPASYPLGTTPVTQTATDGSGNSSSCSSTVTVQDTTPPNITCPSNITVPATGPNGATVDVPAATASDVSGGVSVSDPAPAVYPLGTTTVSQTATDDVGLTASCSSTVTVVQAGPTSKAQCQNGGWRNFGDMFKNQGECVRRFGA